MTTFTPLTVPEARAILIADDALYATYEDRLASGKTFSIEELNAWAKIVKSANERIAAFEDREDIVAPLG